MFSLHLLECVWLSSQHLLLTLHVLFLPLAICTIFSSSRLHGDELTSDEMAELRQFSWKRVDRNRNNYCEMWCHCWWISQMSLSGLTAHQFPETTVCVRVRACAENILKCHRHTFFGWPFTCQCSFKYWPWQKDYVPI